MNGMVPSLVNTQRDYGSSLTDLFLSKWTPVCLLFLVLKNVDLQSSEKGESTELYIHAYRRSPKSFGPGTLFTPLPCMLHNKKWYFITVSTTSQLRHYELALGRSIGSNTKHLQRHFHPQRQVASK